MNTVAAISTAMAPAGIGMVRISGDEALLVADRIFTSKSGKRLADAAGYTAAYGTVTAADGEMLDRAVVFVYRSPHSFTGENTVEICCHGGVFLLTQVLRAALVAGAEPAQPGEFSKRAFLNGKLRLNEAEAVMDLICAQGSAAARMALAAHDGALTRAVNGVRERLTEISARLAVWSDDPDEEHFELTFDDLVQSLLCVRAEMTTLLGSYDSGKILREGISAVIAGKPNVGKSTLMNLLSGAETSIVTSVPGTTRDVIAEQVRLGDVVLRLSDTAGLRDTADIVEAAGVERTHKQLRTADLILAVFDASQPLNSDDVDFISGLGDTPAIAILNKVDLGCVLDGNKLFEKFRYIIKLSAKDGSGLRDLKEAVSELTGTAHFDPTAAMLTNERQRDAVRQSGEALDNAIEALRNGVTFDAVNVCIEEALHAILHLTGERVSDVVVDEVFSKFCVGK